ncbi:hypothetical protein NFJ02_03g101770 [Pycnococcus provasolii]
MARFGEACDPRFKVLQGIRWKLLQVLLTAEDQDAPELPAEIDAPDPLIPQNIAPENRRRLMKVFNYEDPPGSGRNYPRQFQGTIMATRATDRSRPRESQVWRIHYNDGDVEEMNAEDFSMSYLHQQQPVQLGEGIWYWLEEHPEGYDVEHFPLFNPQTGTMILPPQQLQQQVDAAAASAPATATPAQRPTAPPPPTQPHRRRHRHHNHRRRRRRRRGERQQQQQLQQHEEGGKLRIRSQRARSSQHLRHSGGNSCWRAIRTMTSHLRRKGVMRKPLCYTSWIATQTRRTTCHLDNVHLKRSMHRDRHQDQVRTRAKRKFRRRKMAGQQQPVQAHPQRAQQRKGKAAVDREMATMMIQLPCTSLCGNDSSYPSSQLNDLVQKVRSATGGVGSTNARIKRRIVDLSDNIRGRFVTVREDQRVGWLPAVVKSIQFADAQAVSASSRLVGTSASQIGKAMVTVVPFLIPVPILKGPDEVERVCITVPIEAIADDVDLPGAPPGEAKQQYEPWQKLFSLGPPEHGVKGIGAWPSRVEVRRLAMSIEHLEGIFQMDNELSTALGKAAYLSEHNATRDHKRKRSEDEVKRLQEKLEVMRNHSASVLPLADDSIFDITSVEEENAHIADAWDVHIEDDNPPTLSPRAETGAPRPASLEPDSPGSLFKIPRRRSSGNGRDLQGSADREARREIQDRSRSPPAPRGRSSPPPRGRSPPPRGRSPPPRGRSPPPRGGAGGGGRSLSGSRSPPPGVPSSRGAGRISPPPRDRSPPRGGGGRYSPPPPPHRSGSGRVSPPRGRSPPRGGGGRYSSSAASAQEWKWAGVAAARKVAAARWWWTLFPSSASAQEWRRAGVAATRKVAAARWWWTLFPSSSSAQEWRRAGVAAARKVAAARRRRRWRRRTLFPSASAQKGERTDVAAAEGW